MSIQEQSRPGLHGALWSDRLVWFEMHETADSAIRREKQIKEWKREWKFNLIGRDNPHWSDLYNGLLG
jgi:putative endonuclease